METTTINIQDNHNSIFKQWTIFNIVCESDFSKIFTGFPTIKYVQILEFVTECLKTDTLNLEDERSIERALTAIQQPGAEHVVFTINNTQFHLYYTEILEPIFI